MPTALMKALRADSKRSFFCPNGHSQHYTESEADRLRRERDRLKQQIAQEQDVARQWREEAEREKARAAGYKGVATKMRNRVAKGVCPCCNRTFLDLARHMATKHPDIDNVIPLTA